MSSADNFCEQFDPDQARQNVGPDLDANCLKLIVFLKEFLEKVDFENKNQQTTKKREHLSRGQRGKVEFINITVYCV